MSSMLRTMARLGRWWKRKKLFRKYKKEYLIVSMRCDYNPVEIRKARKKGQHARDN